MASSPNNLTNSFFFYGTHPIRVPMDLSHSNSANNIYPRSNQQTHHLSLPPTHTTNHQNGFSSISPSTDTDRSSTQVSRSCANVDEEAENFEDARESFDGDEHMMRSNRSSFSGLAEEPTTNWIEAFAECNAISKLAFQNHMVEGLQRTTKQQNRSLYHSLCHSTLSFIKAGLTFSNEDIEATIQATRHTIHMAKTYEPAKPWVSFGLRARPAPTEYELHAKLVYAEATLIRALLTFTQDQGLFGFINGALKLKECNDIFMKLTKQNDRSRFSSDISYEHFDSGVRMGNGLFNLMISNLPQRIIRYLQFAGFSGVRELGLSDLKKSALTYGLRATFSALYLLTFHTFIVQVFGNANGDHDLCQMLVERNLQIFPNSYLFLFFKARLQTLRCRLDEGLRTYQYAVQCQQDWKNLSHISFWEMFWCHVLLRQWREASVMAETLLNENNWSKATYSYMLGTCLFEENNGVANDEVIEAYNQVPRLKIKLAGKSIPLEKYAIKKCEHFCAQGWLFLPALELAYLMNGFYILAHDQERLKTTLDIVDRALDDLKANHRDDQYYADSYGTGQLFRGVLLHFLQRYDEAHEAFDEIMKMAKKFDDRSFLPANACLEKGLLYLTLKQKSDAHDYLRRSLDDYKDYLLESRVQFRINAGLQTVKRMEN